MQVVWKVPVASPTGRVEGCYPADHSILNWNRLLMTMIVDIAASRRSPAVVPRAPGAGRVESSPSLSYRKDRGLLSCRSFDSQLESALDDHDR